MKKGKCQYKRLGFVNRRWVVNRKHKKEVWRLPNAAQGRNVLKLVDSNSDVLLGSDVDHKTSTGPYKIGPKISHLSLFWFPILRWQPFVCWFGFSNNLIWEVSTLGRRWKYFRYLQRSIKFVFCIINQYLLNLVNTSQFFCV